MHYRLKDFLQTLASNMHILLVSLLIVGLNFGMATNNLSSTNNGHANSVQSHQSIDLSTSPTTAPQTPDPSSSNFAPITAPSSPQEAPAAPSEPNQNIGGPDFTTNTLPPANSDPPDATCTACDSDPACISSCPATPAPAPTPPPEYSCGACGYNGDPEQPRVMCPMATTCAM